MIITGIKKVNGNVLLIYGEDLNRNVNQLYFII